MSPLRSLRIPASAHLGVAGLLAFAAAFVCLGQLVDNRLLQAAVSLAVAFTVWSARDLAAFYSRLWKTVFRKGTEQRGQQLPLVAVSLVFCALTLWGLLSNLVDPQYGITRYAYLPVLIGAAGTGLLLPAVFASCSRAALFLASRRGLRLAALASVFTAFFVIQVFLAAAVRIAPGWDAQAVMDTAIRLSTGEAKTLHEGYFSRYPNNIMLVLALSRYFDFVSLFGVTDLILAGVVLNCLALLLGAVLTYVVARRIGGEAVALFTLLPSFIFLVVSPWIMVVYSDTLALPFPILLFYLYLVQSDLENGLKRTVTWVFMGVIAVIAFNIKPTTVFVQLAVAVVGILHFAARKPTRKTLLTAIAGTAVVAGSFAGASYALTSAENASDAVTFDLRTNNESFPVSHFLKMGAQANGGVYNPYYGSFHEPDVVETSNTPAEERFEQNLHSYVDRVQEMGVSGYLAFLSSKLTWFLGDGSFFLWGEGVVEWQPFLADDPLSQDLQSYYGYGNENYGTLVGVWQAAWFILLALIALPLFLRAPLLFTRSATVLRVAMLGLFVFLLFFEARARYLYLYLPIIILLASLTVQVFAPGRKPVEPERSPDATTVPGSAGQA